MEYQLTKLLGQGSFGKVYEAETEKGEKVAMKFFIGEVETTLTELDVLFRLQNPHLIQGFEILPKYRLEKFFRDGSIAPDTNIAISEELITGSLAFGGGITFQRYFGLEQNSKLAKQIFLKLIYQVCAALNCLMTAGYYHVDIKPDNILYHRKKTIKSSEDVNFFIGDYGLMAVKTNDDPDEIINLGYMMGTYFTAAPEMKYNRVYGNSSIYSFGVSLAGILTGVEPSVHENAVLRELTLQGRRPTGNSWIDHFTAVYQYANEQFKDNLSYATRNWSDSKDMTDLILLMLIVNPQKRPTVSQLLDVSFASFKTDEPCLKLVTVEQIVEEDREKFQEYLEFVLSLNLTYYEKTLLLTLSYRLGSLYNVVISENDHFHEVLLGLVLHLTRDQTLGQNFDRITATEIIQALNGIFNHNPLGMSGDDINIDNLEFRLRII